MKKKLFQAVICGVYLVVCVTVVNYFFYRSLLPEISCKISDRKLSPFEKKAGVCETDLKKSSFLNFPAAKNPGTVRIGCFGDSFVFGHEVGSGYSYPDFLQSLFNDCGYNVEVLNFGRGAASLVHSFIMWQEYNKKYNLDYVILGPQSVWPERDLSFCSFFYDSYWYNRYRKICYNLPVDEERYQWLGGYMHAKIILKGDKLVLLEPQGDTTAQRYSLYTRWLPPWRYLRYDASVPLFVVAPLLKLFPVSTLNKNPFYYNHDPDEIKKIYNAVLEQMQEGSGGFVFLPNIFIPDSFPYVAPFSHESPQGNYFIARQYFDFLVGKTLSSHEILIARDIPGAEAAASGPLNDYTDIAFELGGQDIGYFCNITDKYNINCGREIRHPLGCKAMLALCCGHNIMESIFIPLDFLPVNGGSLKLEIQSGFKKIELPMGVVKAYGNTSVVMTKLPDNILKIEQKLALGGAVFFSCKVEGYSRIKSLKIILDGHTIVVSKVRGSDGLLGMVPQYGYLGQVRASGARFVDVDKLPDTGIIFLKLYKEDGTIKKFPFAEYSKKEIRTVFLKHVEKPVTKESERIK